MLELIILKSILKDYDTKPTYRDFMNKEYHISALENRYAELGHVHRNEASGALNGLFRVRTFTQDDAHILLRVDQIGDEITNIIARIVYNKNMILDKNVLTPV